MWIRRGLFLGLVLVALCLTRVNLRAVETGPEVYLNGVKMGSEIQVLTSDQVTYLNLSFLRKAFHVNTIWRQTEQQLYFKLGATHYTFYLDSPNYIKDCQSSQKKSLNGVFQESNGQLWLPLDFMLELGLKIERKDSRKICLTWKSNQLLDVANTTWHERPAFLVAANNKLKVNWVFTKEKSLQLICELSDIELLPGLPQKFYSEHPLVKQVRIKAKGKGKIQLLFDLKRKIGARIFRNEENPNLITVVPDYRILDVSLAPRDKPERVVIESSGVADFKVVKYQKGERLDLLFSGAVNAVPAKKLRSSLRWVRSISVNKVDEHSVKVSMALARDVEIYAARSPGAPNRIEVAPVPVITAISWTKTESGGDLTIVGDGAFSEHVESLSESRSFQLALKNVRLGTEVNRKLAASDPIEYVKVNPLDQNQVRFEARYRYWGGMRVDLTENRQTLVVHFTRSPLIEAKVVLDPGHGGCDESAASKLDVKEKAVALETAMRLKVLLEKAGAHVLTTRYDDCFIGLYERSQFANNHRADLFVSIHANYQTDSKIKGVEVYYYPDQIFSRKLAQNVMDGFTRATGSKNLGVIGNDFAVIRETEMPAILIELGYLSNDLENERLDTSTFKEQAAQGIFQGIVNYMQ